MVLVVFSEAVKRPALALLWLDQRHHHKCIKVFINSYTTLLHFESHHLMPHFKPLIFNACSLNKSKFFMNVVSTMVDPIVEIAVFGEV